jgi:outer membrane protein TolC
MIHYLLTFIIIFSAKISAATTLFEAINKAYNHSEYVQIQELNYDIAVIDRDAAFLSLLPEISYTFGYKKHDTDIPSLSTVPPSLSDAPFFAMYAKKSTETNSVFSTRSSLSFHKSIPGLMTAIKAKDAKYGEMNVFMENFGLSFIKNYLDIIYTEKSLNVLKKIENIVLTKLKKLEVLYQQGVIKNDKLTIVKSQLLEIESRIIALTSDLESLKVNYKILTGDKPENLTMPAVPMLPFTNQEEFISTVILKNSTLYKTTNEKEQAKHYNTFSILNNLPDIYSEFSVSQMKTDGEKANGGVNSFAVNRMTMGIGVSLTINTMENKFSNARKAYKFYKIANLNHSVTLQKIEEEAKDTWNKYIAMHQLMKSREENVAVAQDSLEQIKVSVKSGTASFVDEMDIEKNYLEAELNLLDTKRNIIMLYYKIISMTGVGKMINL